ncbi:peptidylprolyl isomerase [Delftia acidovorans]|uniref:peptidylprolyl isomerase n=1 Tax=Delftia acidovorans TaxID=80866 RepID=UPI00241CFAC6|nr:peptidylprolyl isomerase [Delftia acidovorans]
MKLSTIRFSPAQCWALAVLVAGMPLAHAADAATTFAHGGQVAVTSLDVEADVQGRLPTEVRKQALSSKQTVGQIAENLYVRRTLGEQAAAQELDKDPKVAAALRVARDKVLSDELMNRAVQKSELSADALLKQARTVYTAKPERFQAPEQVQARHILIAGTTPEAKAQAEAILAQLKGGADFAKLAQEHSADKGSAARGGDLGLFAKGRMVPEFEAAAFALQKKGDLSSVVQTQFGYHVIQLEEKRPAGLRPFDEVKDELVREVRAGAADEARMALVRKAQEKIVVDSQAVEAFAASQSPAAQAAEPSVKR